MLISDSFFAPDTKCYNVSSPWINEISILPMQVTSQENNFTGMYPYLLLRLILIFQIVPGDIGLFIMFSRRIYGFSTLK